MPGWSPSKIRWVNDTLASSTGASRVETDAGPGFAKLLGNPEGPHVLFCEAVGTRAAAWLGLPTFEFAIIDVAVPELVTYPDGSKSLPGPAFVTREENGTTWGGTGEELAFVENPEVLSGLVVLDTWLLNCDRFRAEGGDIRKNTRNVFLSSRRAAKGKFEVIAMDHTHTFTCGKQITKRLADIGRVKDERLYGHFPEFRPYLSHTEVKRFADRLQTFTRRTADELVQGLPSAWLPSELQRIVSVFLSDRAAFLGPIVRQMLLDQGELQPELELGG